MLKAFQGSRFRIQHTQKQRFRHKTNIEDIFADLGNFFADLCSL